MGGILELDRAGWLGVGFISHDNFTGDCVMQDKTGCATCGEPTGNAEDFRDDLSMLEYTFSRTCQVCQDRLYWVLRVAEVELAR